MYVCVRVSGVCLPSRAGVVVAVVAMHSYTEIEVDKNDKRPRWGSVRLSQCRWKRVKDEERGGGADNTFD